MTAASMPQSFQGEATKQNRRDDLISQIVEYAPDAIWVVERSSSQNGGLRIAYANAAFEAIYEIAREEAIGQEVAAFLASRAVDDDLSAMIECLAGAKAFEKIRYHLRRDGRPMWLHVNYQPRINGDHTRWIVISRDVTSVVLAQKRAEQLAKAIEQVQEPIVIESLQGERWIMEYVNNAFAKLFRHAPEELIGRSWVSLLASGGDYRRAEECRSGLKCGRTISEELAFRRKDGSELVLRISGTPIAEKTTQKYASTVTLFIDVTETRREERRLRDEMNRDPLTGLCNRREFENLLVAALEMTPADEPAHVLLFIDLDGFKSVNDAFGHDVGDRVLIAAANELEKQLLPSDDLARWGGDEFAALLYYYDLPNAVHTAMAMIDALAGCVECRGIGASIGVVQIAAGHNVEELMRCADRLMYQAKSEGRNRVVTSMD